MKRETLKPLKPQRAECGNDSFARPTALRSVCLHRWISPPGGLVGWWSSESRTPALQLRRVTPTQI